MNTSTGYERRTDRSIDEPSPAEQMEIRSALATHPDPSQSTATNIAQSERNRPSIEWLRPSDLHTVVGAPWVRRGIDLQADLTRRARRTPVTTVRAGQRITRSTIARPQKSATSVTTREELGL